MRKHIELSHDLIPKYRLMFCAVLFMVISCQQRPEVGEIVESDIGSDTKIQDAELSIDHQLENKADSSKVLTEDLVDDKNSDSLDNILIAQTQSLVQYFREGNYQGIRDLLHPDGVYFFTLGHIETNKFNEKTLSRLTGKLDGAYSYQEIDTTVTGLYFVNEISNRYDYSDLTKNSSFQVGDIYSVPGFGLTGNYSSPYLDEFVANFYEDDYSRHFEGLKVVETYFEHPDFGHGYLLVEFLKHDSEGYKIFAIGDLEWTP